MEHLGALLATLPLPPAPAGADAPPAPRRAGEPLVHALGADMPAGHLHVWGGPSGAGKTSLLLTLLEDAALRGRGVVYATYDLPPSGLALRMLAIEAGVELSALPDPGGEADGNALPADEAARVHAARETLSTLPFWLLPARGFGVASLADRLVRMPRRPQVVVVDYLQGVVRTREEDVAATLRGLSEMAKRLHVSVVGVFRPETAGGDMQPEACLSGVDRLGWLTPAEGDALARADILANRHGPTPSLPIHHDRATGRVVPKDATP